MFLQWLRDNPIWFIILIIILPILLIVGVIVGIIILIRLVINKLKFKGSSKEYDRIVDRLSDLYTYENHPHFYEYSDNPDDMSEFSFYWINPEITWTDMKGGMTGFSHAVINTQYVDEFTNFYKNKSKMILENKYSITHTIESHQPDEYLLNITLHKI